MHTAYTIISHFCVIIIELAFKRGIFTTKTTQLYQKINKETQVVCLFTKKFRCSFKMNW